jgi:hypothetical protein
LESHQRNRLGFHSDFLYLTCSVTSTDDRSAIDAAYRKIKSALGVLNLVSRGFGVSHRFGYPNAPLGRFLSASTICTIDRKNRKLGGYLSENHYPTTWKHSFTVWQRNDSLEISKLAKLCFKDLKRIDFADRIIQTIVLFQEGLESTHIDIALLKFWTGIELICAREEREPTERVVERASSIFVDSRHAAMRLNFIQDFRNKIVHRGDVGGHSLLCAQWGSIYLAELILFCLFNRFKFRTREQLLEYLSAPVDVAGLMRTISIYRKRLRALRK